MQHAASDNRKRCYIIAAIDLAHNGELSTAKKLIDMAVECGCDAVKLQKRCVDQMVVESVLHRPFLTYPEFGRTYGEVFRRLELSGEEYASLRTYCAGRIDFLVAPFDLESLDSCLQLDVDAYKVDPQCATDLPLLEALARQQKRILASVGMCSAREVAELVHMFRDRDLVLLYCVSSEPAPLNALNLNAMKWLGQFGRPVGYTDTTDTLAMGAVAVALGAGVVEKRITVSRRARGFNHALSLELEEMKRYVEDIRGVEQALGKQPAQEILPCEASAHDEERKSVVAASDINAGTVLKREMLACKAPLRGLTPNFIPYLIGKKLAYDLKRDDPITFGMIE
jgi:N-acetylneuraminate synthase/N,N'-diacetyllegionaminate synthase